MSRTEAIEAFLRDGWHEINSTGISSYTDFLKIVNELGEYDFISDYHVKNLFVFPASSKRFWARHELVQESKVLLQDKASCLPAQMLDPKKRSVVLDMCAAPGMKTTHLAAIMKNKGTIYAIEQDSERYKILLSYINNSKANICKALLRDTLTLNDEDCPNVEYILVDPTCSGSGMVNRLFSNPTITKPDADRLYKLAGLQIKILTHAMTQFPQAKRIVYSTCSVYREENEEVVAQCLQHCSDWKLIKPQEFADKWLHFGTPKIKHIGKKCFYAKSEIDGTDGFFLAIFEREIDDENVPEPDGVNGKRMKLSEEANGDGIPVERKKKKKKLE